MAKPRDEALAALTLVADGLRSQQPIDGLFRATLTAHVAYAISQVELIEELKRKRKKGSAA